MANVTISEIKKSQVKKEVGELNNSPMFWLNSFNRSCKKSTAIEGISFATLTKLYKLSNEVTGRGFTFEVLPKNKHGQICVMKPFNEKKYKGGEIISNYIGEYELVPVSTTNYKGSLVDAIMSYFVYRAKVTKDLESQKGKAYTKHELFSMLKSGEISEIDFIKLFENAA